MVGLHTGSAPLYNMGAGVPRENSNLIPGLPSERLEGYCLSCDKLVLRVETRDVPDEFVGGRFPEFRKGRNWGSSSTEYRFVWLQDYGIRVHHSRETGSVLSRDRVEFQFSPNRVGSFGCWYVGELMRSFGADPDAAEVVRFDPCWTGEDDPYALFWDSRYSKPDSIGETSRGPETHRVGYRDGVDVKAQRYDKRAHLKQKGVEVPFDHLARIEYQCSKQPSPDDPGLMLFLRDLGRVPWPAPDHYRLLRRRPRDPDAFSDPVWELLSWAALSASPKVIRRLSREVLSGRRNDRAINAEFVLFEDLSDALRACYASLWPSVVECVRRFLLMPVFTIAGSVPEGFLPPKAGDPQAGSGPATAASVVP